ncbi:uncharacterized protein LOC108313183 [Cebus imitator]|uniref:uncharacterized protein LOC108313183 n=1 Tax=Cebus imitator TaxID=2715852 RepID=UPI00080A4E03|nr:uncharacterized protein LOC108313183 [Cebus imitator]
MCMRMCLDTCIFKRRLVVTVNMPSADASTVSGSRTWLNTLAESLTGGLSWLLSCLLMERCLASGPDLDESSWNMLKAWNIIPQFHCCQFSANPAVAFSAHVMVVILVSVSLLEGKHLKGMERVCLVCCCSPNTKPDALLCPCSWKAWLRQFPCLFPFQGHPSIRFFEEETTHLRPIFSPSVPEPPIPWPLCLSIDHPHLEPMAAHHQTEHMLLLIQM